MGAARLLARGWIAFCLFAAGHALRLALISNVPAVEALQQIGVSTALYGAMGILFIAGYGLSSGFAVSLSVANLRPTHLSPGFNELVFIVFALLAFYVQTVFAPLHATGPVVDAIRGALRFAVFGQRVLEDKLSACGLDGGRALTSAVSWLLAFIFFGSAVSRVRLAAAIVRFERKTRIEALGPQSLALALGIASVVGIQMLFIGSAYTAATCGVLSGLLGDVLIGIGPLMLSYLIVAAITNLLALGQDG
ncbi:MAG: hypothetical protein ABSD74_17910 [Rhizomicrobium sp.]|jgi:hypothetical protein